MIYRIASLQNGLFEWVTDHIDSTEVLQLEVLRLIPIWGEDNLLVFQALDVTAMSVARLNHNANLRDLPTQQRKARAAAEEEQLSREYTRRAMETGAGGDHDYVYRFLLPSSGKQESVWCFMLGEVKRGEHGPEPRLRIIEE